MSDFEDKLNSILSSPKDMEKIMGLAKSLSGGAGEAKDDGEKKPPPPEAGGFDPKLMGMLGKLMSQYSSCGDERKLEILRVMKPYLREERRAGLSRAVEIAKLAKVAKIAFSEFTPGGDKNS